MFSNFFSKKTKVDPKDRNKYAEINPSLIHQLKPGDIIKFDYVSKDTRKRGRKFNQSKIDRIGLIISTERGKDGKFLSTLNNFLLCVVQLNESSPSFKLVLYFFHNKDKRCKYKLLPGFLKTLFGLSAFKTFKIAEILNSKLLLKG